MTARLLRTLALFAGPALVSAATAGCFQGDNGGNGDDGGPDGIGIAQGALLAASPPSKDFGTVRLGAQSASVSLAIANTGTGASGPLAVSLAGADAASFGIDADGCSGTSLAAGSGCTVQVHFLPEASGAKGATLTVSGQPGGSATVTLSGTGGAPGALGWAPTTKDFGTVARGANSAPSTFTLSNGGGAATGAVTLSLTGSDGADFALSADGCSGKPLGAGANCTVGVTLSPGSVGSKAATLVATAAGVTGTASASLSGTALTPAGFASTPASYDFGPLAQGGTSAVQTFTVQNTGAVASGAPTVTVAGASAADFTVTANACTVPLPATSKCTFGLTFKPATTGAESATVTIAATATTAVKISVSGTGLPPAAIAVSPTSQPFGSLAQGNVGGDVPFLVTNSGGVATGALAVTLGGSDAVDFALGADGCTGKALAASGGTCTVNVHFAPSASSTLGNLQAALQVTGTPGGTAAAALTGTALAPALLGINPTSQPFGTVVQGQSSSDIAFTVTNAGGVASGTMTATFGGADGAQYGLGPDTCTGKTLAAGGTCTVDVHFSPAASALGLKQGALTVAATPGGSAAATLTGTATTQAALGIGPASHPFGTIVQGAASGDVTLTVTNGGGVTTGALTVTLGGANAGQFGLGLDTCTGKTLAAAGTCTVAAHFSPSLGTLGAQVATVTVSGSPGGSAPANLTGTAASPLGINPATQPFGTAAFLSPSAPFPFTVSNASTAPVGPLTVALGGANAAQFQIAGGSNCANATLAGGKSCTVNVVLSPASGTTGAMNATLDVSAGVNTAAQSTLTGTAAASAALSIHPPVGFAGFKIPIGQTQSVTFTLANSGGVPSGTPALSAGGDFTVPAGSNGCTGPVGLTPCSFVVAFKPTAASSSATLAATASPGGPATYALSGTGTSPLLGIDVTSWAVATDKGVPVSKTLTVTNKGTAPTATLQVTLAGTADLSMASSCGVSLAPGATCPVTLTFAASTYESVGGSLSVVDTSSDQVSASVSGGAGMVIAPASVDFGSIPLGSSSPPRNFILTNYGATGFISNMQYFSADQDWFLPSDTCYQKTVASGGTCTITFGCTPINDMLSDTMQVIVSNANGVQIANTLNATCAHP